MQCVWWGLWCWRGVWHGQQHWKLQQLWLFGPNTARQVSHNNILSGPISDSMSVRNYMMKVVCVCCSPKGNENDNCKRRGDFQFVWLLLLLLIIEALRRLSFFFFQLTTLPVLLLCNLSHLIGSASASVISGEEQFEDYGEGEDVDFTPSSPCPEDDTRTNGFSDLGSSLPSRLVVYYILIPSKFECVDKYLHTGKLRKLSRLRKVSMYTRLIFECGVNTDTSGHCPTHGS